MFWSMIVSLQKGCEGGNALASSVVESPIFKSGWVLLILTPALDYNSVIFHYEKKIAPLLLILFFTIAGLFL
jgi:hypothetical protein